MSNFVSIIFSSKDELSEVEAAQTNEREGHFSSLSNFLEATSIKLRLYLSREVPSLLDDHHLHQDNLHGHHHRFLVGLHTKVTI